MNQMNFLRRLGFLLCVFFKKLWTDSLKPSIRFLYYLLMGRKSTMTSTYVGFFLFIFSLIFLSSLLAQKLSDRTAPLVHQQAFTVTFLSRYAGFGISDCGIDPKAPSAVKESFEQFVNGKARNFPQANVKYLKKNAGHNFTGGFYSITDSVVLWWKLLGGPTWAGFCIYLGLVYAIGVICAYALFRQGSACIPSALAALVFVLMPSLVYNMCDLRDTTRFLPMLGFGACILYWINPGTSWKKVMILTVLASFIIAFGQGFRGDFVILVPFYVAAILLFHGGWSWKNLRKKLLLIIVPLAIGFSVPAYYEHKLADRPFLHNEIIHVYFGWSRGLLDQVVYPSEYFVCNAPACWDWVYNVCLRAIAEKDLEVKREIAPDEFLGAGYSEVFRYMWYYPYNIHLYATASLIRSLQGAMNEPRRDYSISNQSGFEKRGFPNITPFTGWLLAKPHPAWAAGIVAFALFLVGLFSIRRFIFFSIILYVLGGLYSIQFQLRHHMYLFAIVLLAFLFSLFVIIRLAGLGIRFRKRAFQHLMHHMKVIGKRLLAMLAVIAAFWLITFGGCRLWQKIILERKVAVLTTAERQDIPYVQISGDQASFSQGTRKLLATFLDKEKDLVHLDMPDLNGAAITQRRNPKCGTLCEYLLMEFDFGLDYTGPRDFLLRYQDKFGNYVVFINRYCKGKEDIFHYYFSNFSQVIEGPGKLQGKMLFVAPVYYGTRYSIEFSGVSLPKEFLPHLKRVSYLVDRKKMFMNSTLWIPLENFNGDMMRDSMGWHKLFFDPCRNSIYKVPSKPGEPSLIQR